MHACGIYAYASHVYDGIYVSLSLTIYMFFSVYHCVCECAVTSVYIRSNICAYQDVRLLSFFYYNTICVYKSLCLYSSVSMCMQGFMCVSMCTR